MHEKKEILIRMLTHIGILEDTIIAAAEELEDNQLDEMIEFVIERHEEGKEVTNEEVVKALLILMKENGAIS